MTARRTLKNIVTRPGKYITGRVASEHGLILYGGAAEPAQVHGRMTETHLSAKDIREHVLLFVAEHPDEFAPAVRAITALWDESGTDYLDDGIHNYSLSVKERLAFRRAATTESEKAR